MTDIQQRAERVVAKALVMIDLLKMRGREGERGEKWIGRGARQKALRLRLAAELPFESLKASCQLGIGGVAFGDVGFVVVYLLLLRFDCQKYFIILRANK